MENQLVSFVSDLSVRLKQDPQLAERIARETGFTENAVRGWASQTISPPSKTMVAFIQKRCF
jgi:hypothetical protein